MTVYHKPSGVVKLMNSIVSFLAADGLMPSEHRSTSGKGRR